MASIRKRGDRFQVLIRKGSKQYSRTFGSKEEARMWAMDVELQQMRSKEGRPVTPLATFRDFIDLYDRTVIPNRADPANERIVLGAIRRRKWAGIPIEQLEFETFTNYRDQRMKEIAPSSLQREFKMLRAIARCGATKWGPGVIGLLEQVKLPRVEPPEIGRISEETFAKLRDTAVNFSRSQWLDPLICFAIETGMRRGEILKLTWDRIDLDAEWIRVPGPITKSRKPRQIPITARCRAALDDLRRLFPDSTHVCPKTPNAVRCAWERLRIQAGFPYIRFHDFRHEFVSRCFERGMTIVEVQKFSGHTTMSQLQVYSHAEADAAAAKLKGEQS